MKTHSREILQEKSSLHIFFNTEIPSKNSQSMKIYKIKKFSTINRAIASNISLDWGNKFTDSIECVWGRNCVLRAEWAKQN